MKVHVFTYGCQMNENDTEIAKQLLANAGFEIVPSEDEADIVILNTCAVRKNLRKRSTVT